jgi:hypothetical protein
MGDLKGAGMYEFSQRVGLTSISDDPKKS